MNILVACEESQAVTKELRRLGHKAFSCDIIPCSGGHPEWHIMQDVLPLLNGHCGFTTCDGLEHYLDAKWDMIIAFPPCTYLTNAGARHLWKNHELNQERYEKGLEAKAFFMMFYNADCERIAIENPTPSRIFELPEKTQVIQPYQFGHPFTKRTQLWLKGLPPLQPTEIVEPERTWCPSGSYSKKHGEKHRGMFTTDRAKNRSKTFPGIAKAMAEQWAGNINIERKDIKQMELRIDEFQTPSTPTFNYEELKQGLVEKVSMYTNLVYTDEQIKEAKTDKASLNKLKKALNDERIRLEREYMQPFNDTKAKFNELIALIDEPVKAIDTQVKAYEYKQKQDKIDNITSFFNTTEHPEWLHMSQIFDEKWLNASTSMKSVQDEINSKLEQIQNDLATLQNLPEFGFEAAEVYKNTLDINKALNEGKRLSEIAKAKAAHEAEMKARAEEQARLAAEAEAKKAEQIEGQVEFTDTKSFDENVLKPTQETPAELPMWIAFKACLTVAQAKELKQFFSDRNIEFKAV